MPADEDEVGALDIFLVPLGSDQGAKREEEVFT
jgi:hypothetical protein